MTPAWTQTVLWHQPWHLRQRPGYGSCKHPNSHNTESCWTVFSLYLTKLTNCNCVQWPDRLYGAWPGIGWSSRLFGPREARKWHKHQVERARLSTQLGVTWLASFGHLSLLDICFMKQVLWREVLLISLTLISNFCYNICESIPLFMYTLFTCYQGKLKTRLIIKVYA